MKEKDRKREREQDVTVNFVGLSLLRETKLDRSVARF